MAQQVGIERRFDFSQPGSSKPFRAHGVGHIGKYGSIEALGAILKAPDLNSFDDVFLRSHQPIL
jgi:hypothetical protein